MWERGGQKQRRKEEENKAKKRCGMRAEGGATLGIS